MSETDPGKKKNDSDIEQSLYAKRVKIHPREVHGIFAQLRISAASVLLGLFYGLPWLQWDGHQAILFDLPARKFHIFGLTLWPQDFLLLALLLIIAGLALFFFTTLAGRLWCGYACPQTVWTEVFLAIERWVEGDRGKQIKLDKSPMSVKKFRTKATKHTAWILFSVFTGFTFVAYFTPLRDLVSRAPIFELSGWETFWIFFYGFATYGNAGWMREQVCLHMCPYARFQSAMFDNDTLIISYNQGRGEPRGARKRNEEPAAIGLGDCIGCTMCVQVCPTGIDIRDGLQYECIGCSACIDVCDDVMDKMGYEKNLIEYTTQNTIDGKPSKIIRPRIIIYGLLLLSLIGIFTYLLATRVPLQLDVIRDRNALFRETNEGLIENVYTLKLINMDESDHDFTLTTKGLDGLELIVEREIISVKGGDVIDLPVRLRADEVDLEKHSSTVYFNLTAKDDPKLKVTKEARFLGPRR
ncbi:MAG: cytochrome c oxidase accessory protein CcoG [Gammaproteobacteria bacterium]